MMSVALKACALLAVVAQGQTIPERVLSRRPRMIDGTNAILGEIPYQVSLQYFSGVVWIQFCGGSILDANWIITAAHCITGREPNEISIIAGTVDLEEPFSKHNATKIISHPDYNATDSHINDVSLIKVDPPFNFSSSIMPADFPEPNAEVITNNTATISGWGLNFDFRLTDKLKKAIVYIIDQKVCHEAMQKEGLNVYSTQFCTNHPSRRRGDCKADSGGPAVVDGVLVGIISWSIKLDGCGSPLYPSVNTRVSKYIDWINEHIK